MLVNSLQAPESVLIEIVLFAAMPGRAGKLIECCALGLIYSLGVFEFCEAVFIVVMGGPGAVIPSVDSVHHPIQKIQEK